MIYQDTEICICAAIKDDNGYIWKGHRHVYCMDAMKDGGVLYSRYCIQGFVTSRNRFVTREEGMKLQITTGIPSVGGGYRGNRLFSEDLY